MDGENRETSERVDYLVVSPPDSSGPVIHMA